MHDAGQSKSYPTIGETISDRDNLGREPGYHTCPTLVGTSTASEVIIVVVLSVVEVILCVVVVVLLVDIIVFLSELRACF